jgi:hypothetical protein
VNQWLQWLTALGAGSVLVVLLQGLFGKRKLSAEATKIITDAASGVVEIQKAELARVLASNTMLIAQVEAQRIQLEEVQRVVHKTSEALAIHAYWDSQVVDIAREHDIDLPPPPPLTTGS